MISYEIVPENSLSAAEIMVGIENALRSKKVLSLNAERHHSRDDEAVFRDTLGDTDICAKVYLRTLYLSDVETLDLEFSHFQWSDSHKRLVLIFSRLDFDLEKTFEVHAKRIMNLLECQELVCYEYLPLVSDQGAGIALRQTLAVRLPKTAVVAADTPSVSPDNYLAYSCEYDFHSRAALSRDELLEFLDLGVLSKKWPKTTVSVDI